MKASPRPSLNVERLEFRDLPSVSVPSFNITNPPALPTGWTQWSSDGSTAFTTAAGVGEGGSAGVVSTGASNTTALAWNTQAEPAGTSVSAHVDLTSLVPEFVFAAGSNLGTSSPSYLAAAVTRGASVSLIQVSGGAASVLATASSPAADYLSGHWVEVTLDPTGTTAGVQVVRLDTNQYLNASGQWQSAPTNAITAASSLAGEAGLDGFGRFPAYSGAVDLDNIAIAPGNASVSPPTVSQSFDTTAVGATPSGWAAWTSNTAGTAGIASGVGVGGSNGYAFTGASNTAAMAWATTPLPAAVTATTDVYVNSLIPAQLVVDGSNLGTASPTYDAVTVARGLQVSVSQIVDGASTMLASLSSSAAAYLSGQWIQVTFTAQGSSLQVGIQRLDTDQWLTSSGTWTSGPTYAITSSSGKSLGAGDAGIARGTGYAGTIAFDNFSAGAAGTLGPSIIVNPNPASAEGYAPAPSADTLFGPNGPSPLDVNQGEDGDCWLLSTLSEVAARDPQVIVNMFTYDGTIQEGNATVGVYTVRFYNTNGSPVSITIDTQLPGGGSWYDQPVNGVLWVALAEKAYAIANGLGYVNSGQPGVNSYAALNTGYPAWALQAITGQASTNASINASQMAADWKADDLIVLSTATPASSEIVAGHNYTVVGYNSTTGLFELLNPWGGTTSSTACPQDPQVYGLFYASASFLTANFDIQTVTTTSADSISRNV